MDIVDFSTFLLLCVLSDCKFNFVCSSAPFLMVSSGQICKIPIEELELNVWRRLSCLCTSYCCGLQ